MGFSRRFSARLLLRLVLLLLTSAAAAALAAFGRAPIAMLLAIGITSLIALSLWRLVNESNVELARFVTALDRTDFSQSFRWEARGAGFEELGLAYERAIDRLRRERASGAGAQRFADTLINSAPTPLLVLGPLQDVAFANKAARRLFRRSNPCSLEQLSGFGPHFIAALRELSPGRTALAHIVLDGLSQRIALDASAMESGDRRRMIVSLKIMQVELDSAELAAQLDLVRVLTHEVRNSLTPVTSLAASALRLVRDLDPAIAPGIGDAQIAISALARRAEELEGFVDSYEGFSETPTLRLSKIELAGWFQDLAALFAATPTAAKIETQWHVETQVAAFDGDVGLLTQVMLNLLKNAAEATADTENPRIVIKAAMAAMGQIKVTVADNGPGFPPALARDVFLPFFTTKPAGTGIGLSFARQIVLLHGGQIGLCEGPGGCLELLLRRHQSNSSGGLTGSSSPDRRRRGRQT